MGFLDFISRSLFDDWRTAAAAGCGCLSIFWISHWGGAWLDRQFPKAIGLLGTGARPVMVFSMWAIVSSVAPLKTEKFVLWTFLFYLLCLIVHTGYAYRLFNRPKKENALLPPENRGPG